MCVGGGYGFGFFFAVKGRGIRGIRAVQIDISFSIKILCLECHGVRCRFFEKSRKGYTRASVLLLSFLSFVVVGRCRSILYFQSCPIFGIKFFVVLSENLARFFQNIYCSFLSLTSRAFHICIKRVISNRASLSKLSTFGKIHTYLREM